MGNKRSLLNVSVSVISKLILFVSSVFAKRYLIRYLGNDINGLNSLYSSIIGVLSVAELGIGDAIIFCMYKPIVDGDKAKVSSLYNLFKRIYRIVGIIIAVAGCAIMPFLQYIAKGYSTTRSNLYLTFGLMLISVVMSYFFSASTSLMNAYRDNYIATSITSGGQLLQQVLQIAILILTKSFIWYLICRIITVIIQWSITEFITHRKYNEVVSANSSNIDTETKGQLLKNIKAMFMHRVGSVLVNSLDSLIISAFIGVSILGKYSNYTTIMTVMMGTLTLIFSSLTSTIGHIFVGNEDLCKKYYKSFYTLNFILGCVFFMGYYGIIDNVIELFFGEGLGLSSAVSLIITLNYFIQFMRQSTLTFRDATGTFYYDRWKPIAEGLSNLILSVIFVILFQNIGGDEFAVIGVLVATIATNLLVCHIVEPHILHKYAFHISTTKYYWKNYGFITIFTIMLFVLGCCKVDVESVVAELFINGFISVGLAIIPIAIAILMDKDIIKFAKMFIARKPKRQND